MHDFSTKIHSIITFMLILSSINLCVFNFFKIEEKLVTLLAYPSFLQEATSGIRISSAVTSSIS